MGEGRSARNLTMDTAQCGPVTPVPGKALRAQLLLLPESVGPAVPGLRTACVPIGDGLQAKDGAGAIAPFGVICPAIGVVVR